MSARSMQMTVHVGVVCRARLAGSWAHRFWLRPPGTRGPPPSRGPGRRALTECSLWRPSTLTSPAAPAAAREQVFLCITCTARLTPVQTATHLSATKSVCLQSSSPGAGSSAGKAAHPISLVHHRAPVDEQLRQVIEVAPHRVLQGGMPSQLAGGSEDRPACAS